MPYLYVIGQVDEFSFAVAIFELDVLPGDLDLLFGVPSLDFLTDCFVSCVQRASCNSPQIVLELFVVLILFVNLLLEYLVELGSILD